MQQAEKICQGCFKRHPLDVEQCDVCDSKIFLPAEESDSAEADAKPSPEPEPTRANRERRESSEHADPPRVEPPSPRAPPDVGAVQRQLSSLWNDYRGRPRTIVLFGHSMSGKTWFLHQAKIEKVSMGFPIVRPLPPAAGSRKAGKGFRIEGTEGLHFHVFRKSERDIVTIADIEGENFTTAFSDELRRAGELLPFLEILARADGYIFMLPAAETLVPDVAEHLLDNVDSSLERRRVGELINSVRCVAAVAERVRSRKLTDDQIPGAMLELMTKPGELDELLRVDHKTRRPAMILLSKSDEYEKCVHEMVARDEATGNPRIQHLAHEYDLDPMGALAHCSGDARALVDQFARTFTQFRVDFVSAFPGHQQFKDGKRNDTVDASIKGIAVTEAIRWMRDAIDRSRLPLPVPHTSSLIAFRRMIDPQFNHDLKRR